MSRVLNVQATEAELTQLCSDLGIGISVLEPLLSGGTRIVLKSEEGAVILERAVKKKLISTPVKRSPFYLMGTPSYS